MYVKRACGYGLLVKLERFFIDMFETLLVCQRSQRHIVQYIYTSSGSIQTPICA